MAGVRKLFKLRKRSFNYRIVVTEDEQALIIGKRSYDLNAIKALQVVQVPVIGAAVSGIWFCVLLIVFWRRMHPLGMGLYLALIAWSAYRLKVVRYRLELIVVDDRIAILHGRRNHLVHVAETMTASLKNEFIISEAYRIHKISEMTGKLPES